MIRDQGPKFNLGYGISPSNIPIGTDGTGAHREGPNPNSGFIAKALYGHPVMRFFATAAAGMVGMHVASKFVRQGGVRLLETVEKQSAEKLAAGIEKNWQTTLLHDYRSIQGVLDQYEGYVRDPATAAEDLTKTMRREGPSGRTRAGFWHTHEEVQKAADGLRAGGPESVPAWTFRDEIQQTLVRQARRLPYELPALYATQRFFVDPFVYQSGERDRPKWYNPVDVLGDFAEQSIKNVATMLTPWEVGQAGLRQGWNRLLTYGDQVATNPAFNSRIHGYSLGMRSILEEVGHSASSLIFNTIQKSRQATGAFGAGIEHAITSSKPLPQRGKELWRDLQGIQREGAYRYLSANYNAMAENLSPKGMGFLRGARQSWEENELYFRNLEAARAPGNVREFTYKGRNHPVIRESIRGGGSELEEMATILHNLRGGPEFSMRGEYARGRKTQAYKKILQEELESQGIPSSVAKRFYDHIQVPELPRVNKQGGILPYDISHRVHLGEDKILVSTAATEGGLSEWHREMQARLGAIASPRHAESIAQNITEVAQRADERFTNPSYRKQLAGRIKSDWRDAYERILLPYSRERLGESRLPYEMFGEYGMQDNYEVLVRKTAQHMGLPLTKEGGSFHSLKDLRGELYKRGFGLDKVVGTDPEGKPIKQTIFDHYQARAFLVDKGVISKPWQEHGFNIFGLRPLNTKDALDKKYFKYDIHQDVRSLVTDLGKTDPYIGESIGRPVGKGVYETLSGKVIDLSYVRSAHRRFADWFSNNFQIPLLHIRPLNTLGAQAQRTMSQRPIIQFLSGEGEQPFVGLDGSPDSWFWTRTGRGRRGRGTVYGHTRGRELAVRENMRPFSTDADSILGRHARLVIRDQGRYVNPSESESGKERFRKIFRIDPDQPHSLFRFLKRVKEGEFGQKYLGKGIDYRNPAQLSEFLQGAIPETLTKEQAEGVETWLQYQRTRGTTPKAARVVREVAEATGNQRILDLFELEDPLHGRRIGLDRIRNADDMVRLVRSTLQQHSQELADLAIQDPERYAEIGQQLARAPGNIRSYLRRAGDITYFDKPSAQAMRTTGINRRLDEFRADMYRYLLARQGIAEEGGVENVLQDLLSNADELRVKGLLTQDEYVELRAATLSMQANYISINTYSSTQPRVDHLRQIAKGISESPAAQGPLTDLRNYEPFLTHHGGEANIGGVNVGAKSIRREWRRRFGHSDYNFEGARYNPFGSSTQVFVPTFKGAYSRTGLRALASATGVTTWNDPEAFSALGVPVGHFFQRLNRYFSTVGLGLEENAFAGPIHMFASGMVGRRVLPAVAGASVIMAADRTLGGLVYGKDAEGDRQYRPLVTGGVASAIAGAQMAAAGLIPGGQTFNEKKEQLLHGEVPIRKGRWWPLGNQPFKGGRIQYFRPSWYRRFMSGYQYTGQNWSSPAERLLYGYDYSPFRPLAPYHWERKHAEDRPYPVTGEYFTGPWGPVTGALNMTLGRVLKPTRLMHQDDVKKQLDTYQQVGMYGMAPATLSSPSAGVLVRGQTGGASFMVPRSAGEILGVNRSVAGEGGVAGDYEGMYRQPYGFLPPPYGTSPQDAYSGYMSARRPVNLSTLAGAAVSGALPAGEGVAAGGDRMQRRMAAVAGGGGGGGIANGRPVSPSGLQARRDLAGVNRYYSQRSSDPRGGYSPYNRVVYTPSRPFPARVMPASNPINPGKIGFQAGEVGYQLQELFGLYGFLFGSLRQGLGFGRQDFTPERPVLQRPSRAYGSERSFWDLNLGGLGDLPNASEGEYGNLEFSEITRRFIPHRRRDVYEVNPIPNQMGGKYPWLPGQDYFVDFQHGDPYVQVPDGEMRLPGKAYERTHDIHPDATGRYGLLDQHSILGDVAPWSLQYKAIDRVVRKMNLSPEQEEIAKTTRKQVSAVNKRFEFKSYRYNADFKTMPAKVLGFKPGDADIILTDQGPIRLAGVRARSGEGPERLLETMLHPGQEVQLQYDVNRPPARDMPLDAIVRAGDINVNRRLLASRENSYESSKESPLDYAINRNKLGTFVRRIGEQIAHRNTIFNTKFMPNRSAIEDWERTNVYGSSFPQWQHPVRDFLKPIAYRAVNRNPVVSATVLAAAGGMFGTTPQSKAAGRLLGGALGFTLGVGSDVESVQTGTRFVPPMRKKEFAVEEYVDILNYVKYSRLYSQARQRAVATEGDDPEIAARRIERSKYKDFQFANVGPATSEALQYRRQMLSTMYGADVYGDVMTISAAIPKRKRDHFLEFLSAPVNERQRILSTAPRLERRILEARWGMEVEKRPDLVEYFSDHELPGAGWEGWDPDVNKDTMTIKIAQNQGLDVSQMGYYPQQRTEANLINISYPDFRQRQSPNQTAAQLQMLLAGHGAMGDVQAIPSPFPGDRVEFSAGVH